MRSLARHTAPPPPPEWADDLARRILARAHIEATQRGASEWHVLKRLIADALAQERELTANRPEADSP